MLLGFVRAMPDTQVKVDRVHFALDSAQRVNFCCNVKGRNHETKTTKEIEREKLVQHAPEQLQIIHH